MVRCSLAEQVNQVGISVTQSFKVTAHKGIPEFLYCKEKKKKSSEAVPLPLCLTTAIDEKKEGKERQEGVWPHFTIAEEKRRKSEQFWSQIISKWP